MNAHVLPAGAKSFSGLSRGSGLLTPRRLLCRSAVVCVAKGAEVTVDCAGTSESLSGVSGRYGLIFSDREVELLCSSLF